MMASLQIETSLRQGITVLKKSYCTAPFKIADITENKSSGQLMLMLMSSSPGILDGDQYHMAITLAEGCSLVLQTQSYQRLFSMRKSASQTFILNQDENSTFYFLPHPVVPHENSSFYSKNTISLSANCTLIWGEILTCGRNVNNEQFRFTRYQNLTEVFLNKRLLIRENLLLNPAESDLRLIGQLEGFTHQATLLYVNGSSHRASPQDSIREHLQAQPGISFGITATAVNGFIIKILGTKAEQLHLCLKAIGAIIVSENLKPVSYGA